MPDRLKLIAPLIVVLLGLSWFAAELQGTMSRGWFIRDVEMRAQLALSGAHRDLVRAWRAHDVDGIATLLGDIARDERIMAVAACAPDLASVAATSQYPAAFSCDRVGPHVRSTPAAAAGRWIQWSEVRPLDGGSVNVMALPIVDHDEPLGFVTLIHDLSYIDRRSTRTRLLAFASMAALALCASLMTLVIGRAVWRRWNREVRRALHGHEARPEFAPLVNEVQQMIATFNSEHASTPPWTAERLKDTLRRHLHGEKVVIVANREPYIHQRRSDGAVEVLHPASGLVTALEPVMRACSGVWVAHGSGSADRQTVDRHGRVWVPPDEKSYQIRRVWLSDEEERGYYYGFANEGLWPLCHVAHERPTFRGDDWAHYQRVNQRFADAVCAEAEGDDPIVLVQDYHFALAPRMIRQRLPRATILSFWHIPWPNAERFLICPWHEELLRGMLGASIIGFHTQQHCNNFVETVERVLEARVDREQLGVAFAKRTTLVRPYPISIDWPNRWATTSAPVDECRRSVFAELGLADDALLGVGVDRLDYTKGIEERLLAVERLLERFAHLRGRFTFVQLAAPSRTFIGSYRDLDERVQALGKRINDRFARGSYRAVILRRDHHEPPTVFRYYRAADVCYVSSVHDGMNLVAKEFVAARDDERGVLVLSAFTGAARELTEALLVNPYDLDAAAAALAGALTMSEEEQSERMRAMRALLRHFNVYRWAGRMLIDAAQLRQRERLTDRLGAPLLYQEKTG